MQKKPWLVENLANTVTIAGLILAIWMMITVISEPEKIWTAFFMAIGVVLSDLADGIIARRLKIISEFGKFLDTFRDKIFVCGTLPILTWHYWNKIYLNWGALTLIATLVVLVVMFDLALLAFRPLAWMMEKDISANEYGKWKMGWQCGTILSWMLFLCLEYSYDFPIMEYTIYIIIVSLGITLYYSYKSFKGQYTKCFG